MTSLSHFGLAIEAPGVTPTSRSFRPPCWPPPKDWVCIEDKDGNPVSRYGDPVWDFTPWLGKVTTFSFGDGPKARANGVVIDPVNADLLRRLAALLIWRQRAVLTFRTMLQPLNNFRKIITICSKNRILASDLSRYPAVIDQVARSIATSSFHMHIGALDRLRDARDVLGFELLDQVGIQRLKAAQPDHNHEQTEYIPPRIWTYIVHRVAECRNDFLAHQEQIEACFAFCVDAYEKNGVQAFRERTGRSYRNPFKAARPDITGKRSGIRYYGAFADTALRFGIKEVIERWVGELTPKRGIAAFTNYFHVVQYAALVDVVAFTLMRIGEATSIRWNCLRWEDDPVYGRIPLIEGETTKTDPDDSALWVTSPSVEPSIRVLQSIARMRLTSEGLWKEGENPHIITAALEPWGATSVVTRRAKTKPSLQSLTGVVQGYPFLFDLQQISITDDDLKVALAVCPTLNPEQFQVGKVWTLKWHQFRRTGAVKMFASGEISDSSMQLQMKHMTRLMSLYYGRGNTALHLNDAARTLLVNAFYENSVREFKAIQTDRFISPHGAKQKARLLAPANNGGPLNLISDSDAHHFAKMYRLHKIGGRLTPLGACMNNGPCDGDCVTSIGDCAGGDGKAPCATALFDVHRAPANQKRLDGVNQQLGMTPADTPRYRQLEQEKRGLENYFANIRQA